MNYHSEKSREFWIWGVPSDHPKIVSGKIRGTMGEPWDTNGFGISSLFGNPRYVSISLNYGGHKKRLNHHQKIQGVICLLFDRNCGIDWGLVMSEPHCFFGQHFPSMRAGWSPVGMAYDSARHKSVCWCSKHQQTKSAKTIPKDWKIGMAPAPSGAVAAAVAVLPAPATVVEEPQCCRCDFCVPSGNLLHSYWKWPIEIVDLPIKHSYFP